MENFYESKEVIYFAKIDRMPKKTNKKNAVANELPHPCPALIRSAHMQQTSSILS
jgi:hypothetical protein